MVDLEEDDQKVAMRNRNERAKATSWVALKSYFQGPRFLRHRKGSEVAKALKDTGLAVFVHVDLAVAREERRNGTVLLRSTSHVRHRALELIIGTSFNFTVKLM